jgi:Hydrazine synthase alpha subunit middle domain/WD40-like Beta Propeller Repeat
MNDRAIDRMQGSLIVRGVRALAIAAAAALAGACSSGGWSALTIGATAANDPVSPDYPVAYIKRTLPDLTANPMALPLTDDIRIQRGGNKVFNGPADVFLRAQASPAAAEQNLTGSITQGMWDVRDLDVSFDGTLLVFSMRPPLMPGTKADEQPVWSIYEYNSKSNTVFRVIASDIVAGRGHDVAPHFLPDGRIVFASTRQEGEKSVLIDEGTQEFSAGVESDRNEPAFTLHVMNGDGTNIHQIEYNMSHDLDPSVLNDGRVMFTRWDSPDGAEQGMHLYAMNPDGSNLQLLYGKHSHNTGSPGGLIQFTQVRERPDGKIVALLRPYPGGNQPANVTAFNGITPAGNTEFGGDITLIDTKDFVENTQAVLAAAGMPGPAQSKAVVNAAVTVPGPSPGGRFSSVYPLWDGSNRLLVSWTPCRLVITTPGSTQGLIEPCTTTALTAKTVQTAAPLYGIWIYDPTQNTQQPITPPVEGVMYTDVVALQPRIPNPPVVLDAVAGVNYDQSLSQAQVGILDIKSVYDFDGTDTAPGGISTVRNPSSAQYAARPARFIRLEKAVGLPDKEVLKNIPGTAFGAANYMREILGYAVVDPDGSVMVEVPVNVAFMVSVLDVNGRRIGGIHNNWMQVRSGEVLTCIGCHKAAAGAQGQAPLSHGRGGLFKSANPGATTSGQPFPGTVAGILGAGGAQAGETMAEARARVDCPSPLIPGSHVECAALRPSMDVTFVDEWTGQKVASVSYTYQGLNTPSPLSNAACTQQVATVPAPPSLMVPTLWTAQCRSVIHYEMHIAPLWALDRTQVANGAFPAGLLAPDGSAATTCMSCHSPKGAMGAMVPAGQLDLSATASAAQPAQLTSFRELLFPREPLVLNMGALVPETVPGPIDPKTGLPTQVPAPMLPSPMAGGSARASTGFFAEFDAGGTHNGWLSPAELRLVAEWLDIGAQYYNDPFAIPVAN